MDTVTFNQIRALPKNHWKSRMLQKATNSIISGYRVTALKNRGTFLARFCTQEANRLENQLIFVLGGK